MRKTGIIFLLLLLSVALITGCGPDQKQIQSDYIKLLNKPATEDNVKEASDFLDKYISKFDDRQASEMVIQLEHYILTYDQSGVDYNDWIKKYQKNLIPALTELYQIEAEEQAAPIVEDTTLQVSWAELAKRTHQMEQLIHKYKDEELIKEDALWTFGNYMNAMIMGSNSNPIFDYQTHQFSNDAKAAYMTFIHENPDSVTAWALTEYFAYLNSIDFFMDYNDKVSSKLFFNTCNWLVTESGKRVYQ